MVHSRCTSRRWPAARRLLSLALLVGTFAPTLTAHAQAPARAPDPLDPKASVPALTYESSFKQYRRLGDEKPLSWREANDTVTRIGGWRVYAREAQQPDAAPAPAPAPAPASTTATAPTPATPAKPPDTSPATKPLPMPAGHGGHKTP